MNFYLYKIFTYYFKNCCIFANVIKKQKDDTDNITKQY